MREHWLWEPAQGTDVRLGVGWYVLMLNLKGQVVDGQRKEKWRMG